MFIFPPHLAFEEKLWRNQYFQIYEKNKQGGPDFMAFTEADFLLAPPRKCQITVTAHISNYPRAITLTKYPGNGEL